ncbi:MAG: hypothetical protein OXT67_04590, partial [Zetaproteobacteria bacterium]|nr:hypothetical protein [Zetaproteobacteria bacterium]
YPTALTAHPLRPRAHTHLEAAEARSEISGGVFVCSGLCSPKPAYEVVDETGRVVYRPSHVDRKYFSENLMGRWFADPTPGEIRAFVGSKIKYIPVRSRGDGVFKVKSSDWKQAGPSLGAVLAAAKVIISIKKS